MLIGLKKRKKTIHNPAGREQQTDLVCCFFIWASTGPNGSGRLDKLYRKYGRSENQPFELQERRTEPEQAPTAANQSNTKRSTIL